MIDLSLYVHIPWCIKKCPYCDFNSHQLEQDLPEQAYISALLEDLQQNANAIQGRSLHSIFFGGGTPSLFSPESIKQFIEAAQSIVEFSKDIEITLEANPGTTEHGNFKAWLDAGTTRLSFGVQSFHDEQLRQLGRIHSAKEARHAIQSAQDAGFTKINIDLMHGLPQQQMAQAMADLEQAVRLAPGHISWYQLTIEPNTVFYNRPPKLPEDDLLSDIQDQGTQYLVDNNYQQYEISAFAQPDQQCRHNINYWMFGDYIGIGAGAHSKITLLDKQWVIRQQKTRLPQHYMDPHKKFIAKTETIDQGAMPLEFMMNALRLTKGIENKLYTERTFLQFDTVKKTIRELQERGLLVVESNRIVTTPVGQRFLNDVLQAF